MTSALGLLSRNYKIFFPAQVQRRGDDATLRFGILGAANIAYMALVNPARSHPEVVIHAVAARDQARADAYARKHKIPIAYGGSTAYQDLLDNPEIDVVYNPLPNGLHYEWTMKAIAAGKHVLLEKPSTASAEETSKLFDFAKEKGVVLLEAIHMHFHPAIQRARAIAESGELGKLQNVKLTVELPRGIFPAEDIRFTWSLAGGALMDIGCYLVHAARVLTGSDPLDVISCDQEGHIPSSAPAGFKPNVDRRTVAEIQFPNDVTATFTCDLAKAPIWGFIPRFPEIRAVMKFEEGEVEFLNFLSPSFYHHITVRKRVNGKLKTRVEKPYTFNAGGATGFKGEAWWSSYRYQLEAFVDKIKGRQPQTWLEKEDSVTDIRWIENIYSKGTMGPRPRSSYVPLAE